MQRRKSCPPSLAGNSKGAKRPRAFPSGDEQSIAQTAISLRRSGRVQAGRCVKPADQYLVRRHVWGLSGRPQPTSECKLFSKCGNGSNQRERASNASPSKECERPSSHHAKPSAARLGGHITKPTRAPQRGAQRELKNKKVKIS